MIGSRSYKGREGLVLIRVVMVVAGAAMVAACATATRGTENEILFQSDPPGAAVKVVAAKTACGDRLCQPSEQPSNPGPIAGPPELPACAATPCTIRISRGAQITAEFTLAGYQPVRASVETQFAPSAAPGLAVSAIGTMIDVASGAVLDHCPNPVKVNLAKIGQPARPQPETLCASDHRRELARGD